MRPQNLVAFLSSTLILAAAGSPSPAAAGACTDPEPQMVALYDAQALQVPESIATDKKGNIYVSLALTGQISRISPNGTTEIIATLPIGAPFESCFGFIAGQTGLTYAKDNLYVNVNSCDAEMRGIWRVSLKKGGNHKIASLPPEVFANGIAHRDDYLYVSDSFSGTIFRASVDGGETEIWAEDPLLEAAPGSPSPIAANGVQFFEDELYVANSSTGDIIAFEIDDDDEAGDTRIHATLDTPCDDFAFDDAGTMYCGTNPVNSIVAIYPDGDTEVVLSGDDYLDGPSSLAFGRGKDKHTLYVNNASFPFYPNHAEPCVISLQSDVKGYKDR